MVTGSARSAMRRATRSNAWARASPSETSACRVSRTSPESPATGGGGSALRNPPGATIGSTTAAGSAYAGCSQPSSSGRSPPCTIRTFDPVSCPSAWATTAACAAHTAPGQTRSVTSNGPFSPPSATARRKSRRASTGSGLSAPAEAARALGIVAREHGVGSDRRARPRRSCDRPPVERRRYRLPHALEIERRPAAHRGVDRRRPRWAQPGGRRRSAAVGPHPEDHRGRHLPARARPRRSPRPIPVPRRTSMRSATPRGPSTVAVKFLLRTSVRWPGVALARRYGPVASSRQARAPIGRCGVPAGSGQA